jgi:hypothetical protein
MPLLASQHQPPFDYWKNMNGCNVAVDSAFIETALDRRKWKILGA